MNRKQFFKTLFGIPALALASCTTAKKPILIANDDVKVDLTITSNGKILTLDPKGNVGLGTAYPNYPLYVHFRG
jgi:hypothetical protein